MVLSFQQDLQFQANQDLPMDQLDQYLHLVQKDLENLAVLEAQVVLDLHWALGVPRGRCHLAFRSVQPAQEDPTVRTVLVVLNLLLHRLRRKVRLVHSVQLVQMDQDHLEIRNLQMGQQVQLDLYSQHFQ